MKLVIYGLKNCDTCRKARKALPEAEFVDVREQGLTDEVLEQALTAFGDALLNTRSTTWRGLDAAEREGDPADLIRKHPALMKRPLITFEDRLFLSWNSGIEGEIKSSL